MTDKAWLTVIGIGEDGLDGLGAQARAALDLAEVLVGGARHLDMVPARDGQSRQTWPSPFSEGLDRIVSLRGRRVCILASGDPMMFGVGASLSRRLHEGEMRVIPAPSSFSLAAARLGWPLQDCVTLTVHGRSVDGIRRHIQPNARLLILSEGGNSPARVAQALTAMGYGPSRLWVLEHLGGPRERIVDASAATWNRDDVADLNLVAVECAADLGVPALPTLAGLPDAAFHHEGQITKRDVRVATLARLAPCPGQLLWDVGAGCGSVAIEWMRTHPACRAVAIEGKAERVALIEANTQTLGTPGLAIVAGNAPEALHGLEAPDAVFIGGGLTREGVFPACWQALKPGGRLVANAVTLQGEALVAALYQKLGGELTRISVAQAGPLGGFDGWRTAMPVTLLTLVKA